MSALIDLAGRKFGRWAVIGKTAQPATNQKTGSSWWMCRCKCGTEQAVDSHSLRRGKSTSCGCARTKHGASGTPEFNSWNSMQQRCRDHGSYAFGTKIAARWCGPRGFERFLADMGPRPPGTTLDREERSKGYNKANCRWATHQQQTENRRNTRLVVLDGKTVTFGRAYEVMHAALREGKATFIIRSQTVGGEPPP